MNEQSESKTNVRLALLAAGRVVITTHQRPDGDAIGSVVGLHALLTALGKQVTTILPDPSPANLQWMVDHLDHKQVIVWDSSESGSDALATADTIIIVDLNALSRLGTEPADLGTAMYRCQLREDVVLVNIDHHTHPEAFTPYQWIDVDAPAVCAMLADLFEEAPPTTAIPSVTAMAWYVGIMTDTGSFRFPRTTAKTLSQAAWLVRHGADPVEAAERVLNNGRFEREQLLGIALQSMQRYVHGRLCVMTVRKSDAERLGASLHETEGFVHHTLGISGVEMGILLVEHDSMTKISFRSKGTTYVRDLAASFGGGGHVYAAGARISNRTFTEAVEVVVQRAVDALSSV